MTAPRAHEASGRLVGIVIPRVGETPNEHLVSPALAAAFQRAGLVFRPGDLLLVDSGGVLAEVVKDVRAAFQRSLRDVRVAMGTERFGAGDCMLAIGSAVERMEAALLASVPPQAPARRGQGGGDK